MADVTIKLEEKYGGYSAEVQIVDDLGPLNTWKSLKQGAWSIPKGTFTNLDGSGHAKGCGVIDCWTLDSFDIDNVKPNDTGAGINNDAGGELPVGDLKWTVVSLA